MLTTTEYLKAVCLLQKLSQRFPSVVNCNYNQLFEYSFLVGDNTNLSQVSQFLYDGKYITTQAFIDDLRKPFIETIQFFPKYVDYNPMYVALDEINSYYEIKTPTHLAESRRLLQLIQNSLDVIDFRFLKYPPDRFDYYQGLSWTVLIDNVENHRYPTLSDLKGDLFRIGDDYLRIMENNSNERVAIIASGFQRMFQKVTNVTSVTNEWIFKYVDSIVNDVVYYKPAWYTDYFIPQQVIETKHSKKLRYNKWKKEYRKQTKQKKDFDFLGRFQTLEAENEEAQKSLRHEFAKWLSQQAPQNPDEMTMENFMKYRATVAQEQRDHFKAIQAKNGFIPSHEIIEIFQQSSESRELLDTRKKFCERREGLVAAKMIPVELDEYYETKQQELTMKRQGFFQKRQSWCIKHGLPTSGKSYHYAYLHFLGIKDIDEVIHE